MIFSLWADLSNYQGKGKDSLFDWAVSQLNHGIKTEKITDLSGFEESVCVPDMRIIKLYVELDILNHFSEYRKLITQEGWNLYFQQELDIIQEIWKDDFNLW